MNRRIQAQKLYDNWFKNQLNGCNCFHYILSVYPTDFAVEQQQKEKRISTLFWCNLIGFQCDCIL